MAAEAAGPGPLQHEAPAGSAEGPAESKNKIFFSLNFITLETQ